MAVRKRKSEADYIDVASTSGKETWALCGIGFTALTESPSAQTSSKRYINQSSARQSVTGYEWSAPFEADQIQAEEAPKMLLDIARKQLTGAEAEKAFVQVDLDSPVLPGPNKFAARKRVVAIAVSEMPDNDGELGITGYFLGVCDPIEGTFDTQSKTFTATPAS